MKLGKIKGIEIKIHYSTLVIILMVGYAVSSFYQQLTIFPAPLWQLLLIGLIGGLVILFSITIHELMHSLTALRFGLKTSEIELYLFGGVSKIEEEPKNPKSEILISVIGPLSSLFLSGIFFLALYMTGNTAMQFLVPDLFGSLVNLLQGIFEPILVLIKATLFYSAWANLILGIFNLLPAFPMDGGRVLRAIVWKIKKDHISATKIASDVGKFFGYAFVILGFIEIFIFETVGGLWLSIIGFFLVSSAESAYNQTILQSKLSKISAADLLHEFQITIPSDMPINRLLKEYFIRYKKGYLPVKDNGKIKGIIHISDFRNMDDRKLEEAKAGSIMKKIKNFPKITINQTGFEVFKKINQIDSHPRIVIVKEQNGEILGYIGEEELSFVLKFS